MFFLIALLIGFGVGFGLARLGTWMRFESLEGKFRELANEVHEYTEQSGNTHLPAVWVQDQLDTFIRREFR